jgi:hypothetical protein
MKNNSSNNLISRMQKLAGIITENSYLQSSNPIVDPQQMNPKQKQDKDIEWANMDYEEKVNLLLQYTSNPDEAEKYADYAWDNLPDYLLANLGGVDLTPQGNIKPINEELDEILALLEKAEKKDEEDKETSEETPEEETPEETPAEETPTEETPEGEGSGDVKQVQSALEQAYNSAKGLNDEKLTNQIANTITYFTKTQILKQTEKEEGITEDLFSRLVQEIAPPKPTNDPKQNKVGGNVGGLITALKGLNTPGGNPTLLASAITKIKGGISADKLSTSELKELARIMAEMVRTGNDNQINKIAAALRSIESTAGKEKTQPDKPVKEEVINKIEKLLIEKLLSKKEKGEKEKIVKALKSNKKDFVKRYGKDAQNVMYATATKMAKNK